MPEKARTMEDHLVDEIQRTGYPLEIEISELLDQNWHVFNNQPYLDEDENKTREIDIYASHKNVKAQISEKTNILVSTDIVLECKKSNTHAWVFFTRPRLERLGFGQDQTTDFLEAWSKGKKKFLDRLPLPFDLHYNTPSRIAYTYAEVKLRGDSSGRGESSEREIFEASNQLMKYAAYDINQRQEKMRDNSSGRDVVFLFLAIVLDGLIYEATSKKGIIKLRERSRIILRSTRYSKSKAGMSRYNIDVVTRSYFPQYIKMIDDEVNSILSLFISSDEYLIQIANSDVVELLGNVKRTAHGSSLP